MPEDDATRSKRWRDNHPEHGDPTRNERFARWYAKHRKVEPKGHCSICGKPMKGGWSLQFGFHQKCDRPRYQKLWRDAKKKSKK
jgi:hypothetical protein